MATLRESLELELSRLEREMGPMGPREAVQSLGGGRAGRSALARELSGTSDRSSRAYKSALRNVDRWTTQSAGQRRTPSRASAQRVQNIGQRRELLEQIKRGERSIVVTAELEIDPSPDGTEEGMRPREVQQVPVEDNGWVDAALAGNMDEAAELFGEAMLDAYGGLAGAAIGDVEYLHLDVS